LEDRGGAVRLLLVGDGVDAGDPPGDPVARVGELEGRGEVPGLILRPVVGHGAVSCCWVLVADAAVMAATIRGPPAASAGDVGFGWLFASHQRFAASRAQRLPP